MSDCPHPESSLRPLPYRGFVDAEEWECAACGDWNIKDPVAGVDLANEVDQSVFRVLSGKGTMWMGAGGAPIPVDAASFDLQMKDATVASMSGIGDALLPTIKNVSMSLSMNIKDVEDAFSKMRDALSKQTFMITTAEFERLTVNKP